MSESHAVLETRAATVDIREWQQMLMRQLLRVLFPIAGLALILAVYYVATDQSLAFVPFYVLAFAVLTVLRFWKGAPYTLQVIAFLLIIYLLGIFSLLRAGLSSNAQIFFIALCFIGRLFLGQNAGWRALIIALVTMLVFGVLFSVGVLAVSDEVQITAHKPNAWLSYTLTLALTSAAFVASQNYLQLRLTGALSESRAMSRELDAQRAQAEKDALHAQLHAERMRWVAAFGNTLASLRDRDILIWRVVQGMAQSFDLYQVNLSLTDRQGDMLVVVAASGEHSREWVDEQHRNVIGGRSLLGRVAQTGKEQLRVLEEGQIVHLPLARVEIAFPLVVRGEILGVLDVYSVLPTFSEDDLQLFRIVVGYVAVALDTMRLFEETERQMREMRTLYAQQAVASWRSLLEADAAHTAMAGDVPQSEVERLAGEALRRGTSQMLVLDNDRGYVLIVQLIAREVSLGYLAFTRSAQRGPWDQEQRTLIELAAERLALVLDNTRLLVEVRRQAFYQDQLAHISDVIWRNPSSEAIMEQSVRELGRFLGASEVQLYVTSSPTDVAPNQDN